MSGETTNPRYQAVSKLIDSHYKTVDDSIREQIKQETVDLMEKAEKHGINLSIQMYDKNAPRQKKVQLLHKEQYFF